MTKSSRNAQYDGMVDSMSKGACRPRKRQTHDTQRRRARGLSFVKLDSDDNHHGSSESDESKVLSSSRRTCNPLPAWLANTFMALSKTHPLRLLLPPSSPQASSIQSSTVVGDGHADAFLLEPESQSFSFAMPQTPRSTEAGRYPLSTDGSGLPCSPTLIGDPRLFSADTIPYDQLCRHRDWEPLPFSIPGSQSLLASKTTSNTTFPTALLKEHEPSTSASSLPWDPYYTGPELFSPLAPALLPHSALFSSTYADSDFGDELPIDESSMPAQVAKDSPSFEIYARPGPGYRATHPVYFDSPAQDPLITTPSDLGYELDYDQLDFQWKPFYRDNIMAPKQPTGDASKLSKRAIATPKPELAIEIFDRGHETEDPARGSPNIFRYMPNLDCKETNLPMVPGRTREPCTPPNKLSFAPVPGIYISPLESPSPRLPFRGAQKSGQTYSLRQNYIERNHYCTDVDVDDGQVNNSQISNDSIESWDDKSFSR